MRVVTIITGGVKSNIARTERSLVPGSVYMPVEAEYNRRVKHSQEVGMNTTKYAESVVRQVTDQGIIARLFRNHYFIYEGSKSWIVWIVMTYFPYWFFVSGNSVFFFFFFLCEVLVRIVLMKSPGLCYDQDVQPLET